MRYRFVVYVMKVPHIDKIINIANIPDNNRKITEIDNYDIFRSINAYYSNFTNIDSLKYRLVDKSSSRLLHETDTGLYDPRVSKISGFDTMDTEFSNYSKQGLRRTGLDSDDIWNGNIITTRFENNKIKVIESDFYTSSILSEILSIESFYAFSEADRNPKKISLSDYPLRNSILSTKKHFLKNPYMFTSSSSGGVIIMKDDQDWKILLGRRSDDARVNKNLISVVPNGSIEYKDYKNNPDNIFISALKREFTEEIFSSRPEYGAEFFDKNVYPKMTSIGWKIETGNLSAGYAIFIDPEKYNKMKDNINSNFEFVNIREINVTDIDEISKYINSKEMSPSVIPIVLRSLNLFNNCRHLPELPYDIRSNKESQRHRG